MSEPKGYGIEFEIIRKDPHYVEGYVYIRLKGSQVHVAEIYREWESGIFNRKYRWVVKTVFKNWPRGNYIGGFFPDQETAIENAVRLTKEIFARPGELDDPEI